MIAKRGLSSREADSVLNLNDFVSHLGVALGLGALLGFERQWRQSMAGTRTNALVAAGSATFVMAGYLFPSDFTGSARIAGQVASGIGFLGAGVILKEGASVRGLNTAATVWCSSAIGVMAGIGHPLFALALALGVVITNVVFRPLAYKLHPDLNFLVEYRLEMICQTAQEPHLRSLLLQTLTRKHLSLCRLGMERLNVLESGVPERLQITVDLKASSHRDEDLKKIVIQFAGENGVESVCWHLSSPPAA